MCWVKLNVFHLEVSLKGLAQKFGNISSNKDNIGTFVQILQEMRYHIGHGLVSYLNQCYNIKQPFCIPVKFLMFYYFEAIVFSVMVSKKKKKKMVALYFTVLFPMYVHTTVCAYYSN